MIKMIVAYDNNFGIGKNGEIPWRFPADMSHFKNSTIGNVCIMGRKTWESLPNKFRPLPERKNIIISKLYRENPDSFVQSIGNLEFSGDAHVVDSPESAIEYSKLNWPTKDIFIIGGEEIYRYCLEKNIANSIIVSRIFGEYEVDKFFPKFKFQDRKIISRNEGFDILEYYL